MLSRANQLYEYLTQSALKFPDKVALTFGKNQLTYREINVLTDNMAQNLLQMGLTRGDRVVVCMGNCIETVVSFWSVLKAGGVVSIISDDLKVDKINYIIKDSGCLFFITRTSIANHILQIGEPVSAQLKNIIVTDVKSVQSNDYKFYVDFKDMLSAKEYINIPKTNLDIDLASIIYTSGSTGEPKGVMLTHRNMLAASQSINTYLGNHADDVILSALPLSFDYGLYQMIMAFSVGARLVLEKDMLLPIQFIRKISEESVTALPGVPTLFSILGETFNKFSFNTSSVRYVTNTGAAIYDHHVDIIRKIFPKARFYSMYGLTECKRCTYLPPEELDRKRGSVGIAIPNTEMWVVDDDGKRLMHDQLGQLVIRGATVMKGYWNCPNETSNKLKDGPFLGEKVLFTGDYGVIDKEGFFYFKGRMDETIKSRGIKVSPKEIEEVINAIQGVREAAVVGIPDAVLGYAIVAFVSCYPGVTLDENRIYELCKESIEKAKLPHRIMMVPSLPKSTNGKINKKLLCESIANIDHKKEFANA